MKNRMNPSVNAGSMADIAFLLLIFFLVTTTIETDSGLDRMLPRKEENAPTVERQQRNLMEVSINAQGEIKVDGTVVTLDRVRDLALQFVDNGGAAPSSENYCDYCMGQRSQNASDNPLVAVITVNSNRATKYGSYIAVQNELLAAYNSLRNREARKLFGVDYTLMETNYDSPQTPDLVKNGLRPKIKRIQELYPLNLIEATTEALPLR